MWCSNCGKIAYGDKCDICGTETDLIAPSDVYWCKECKVPIMKYADDSDLELCPLCGSKIKMLTTDIRPVFPEERLLMEILLDKPMAYQYSSVWCSNNRYYIDGKTITINKEKI